MTKTDLISEVLSVADLGCASLDAGMAYDTKTYNDIISCARRAMRWLVANAPLEMLDGTDQSQTETGILQSTGLSLSSNGVVSLPTGYVRLRYLRLSEWARAISEQNVVREESDGYLSRKYDPDMATNDHPYVAITPENKLQVFPHSGTMKIIIVKIPDMTWSGTDIPIPPKMRNAFIYYTAFLLLIGYGDTKAKDVFSVVQNELQIKPNGQ